ncbi:MAG: hypothetical protein ACFFAU_07830 [Candidatus Hodarchaeota archaeon]
MNLIHSEKHLFSTTNLLELLFISSTLFMVLPILVFITMFSHEGGHGIIVVPAIILNREIPEVPTESLQENPFRNFPLGIFSLLLAFPLGIVANGILSYLSIKNAQKYRNGESKKGLFLLSVFIGFCILNLGGILTNFFGQDFSFIIQDILKIPSNEQWFKYLLRIITYIGFPLFLVIKYRFKIDQMLVISGTTYLGYIAVVEMIVPHIAPILMANFWWLFIIGLLVLISTITILIKNIELRVKKSENSLSSGLS